MSSKKLTPCRTVGLSRKKSTGIIPGVLNKSADIDNTTQISALIEKKSTVSQKPRKLDPNLITPCRRVGLSRKRKVTPLYTDNVELNIPSIKKEKPVTSSLINENPVENSNISNETVIPPVNIKVDTMNFNDSTTSKNFEDLQKITNVEMQGKVTKSKVKPEMKKKTKTCLKDSSIEATKPKKLKYSNEQNTPNTSSKIDISTILDKKRNDENFNSSNSSNQFIKVCYKNEEPSSDSEPLILKKTIKNLVNKKNKKKVMLDEDDDDDFVTTPLSLSRQTSKTDVLKLEPKNNLKKSASFISSLDIKDCTVKLEEIKDVTLKYPKKKPTGENSSDDDFDTAPPIPKEQVRTNIEYLEKEIEEKRKTLDELNRAKSLKKLHDVVELKDLTSRWKNGCKIALTDLLEELNKHQFMSMETLVAKFNIPPDFLPLSQ